MYRTRLCCAGEIVYRTWPGVTPAGAVQLVKRGRADEVAASRDRLLKLLSGLHRTQVRVWRLRALSCVCVCVLLCLLYHESI
jgi:hypothetical protein